MQFSELNIMPAILKALQKENYSKPTPIQEQAIPPILLGRDLLGCAQTGTGKTAAFAIPTLQLLSARKPERTGKRPIRSLILTPTRELALQILESFRTYGQYTELKCCVIFGGVSQKPQEVLLQKGIDILVATPGRLNDLILQGFVDLSKIEIFILDEADRMLDMGFIHDVKKIIAKLPAKKQTLLFSATIPPEISSMSNTLLNDPVKIAITPISSTVDIIKQSLYFVDKNNKKNILVHILKNKAITSALVFTRTKHGADKIVKDLLSQNITASAIHGNKSQNARQLALSNFKNQVTRVLVATDIAARGIDIDELSHVINFDLPNVPETYVHRIGRTGRAGLGGTAISFCDFEEKAFLVDIEKLIGKRIIEVKDHPFPLLNTTVAPKKVVSSKRSVASQPSTQVKKGIDPNKKAKVKQQENNPSSKAAHGKSRLERDHMTNQETKKSSELNQKTTSHGSKAVVAEKSILAKTKVEGSLSSKAPSKQGSAMLNAVKSKQTNFSANPGRKDFGAAKKSASFGRSGSRSR